MSEEECEHNWEFSGQVSAFDGSPWIECSKCDAAKYDKWEDDRRIYAVAKEEEASKRWQTTMVNKVADNSFRIKELEKQVENLTRLLHGTPDLR